MFQDPSFVSKVKKRFNDYFENQQQIYDYIDQRACLLKDIVVKDNSLWGTICENPTSAEDVKTAYLEKIAYLKNWIHLRLEWLKTNINAL